MRQLEKMLREVTEVKSLADGWVLQANGHRIYGYHFDLNDAAVDKLCDDKAATSESLLSANLPAVRHFFVTAETGLPELTAGAYVVKPNDGTGARGLARAEDLSDLANLVAKQLSKFDRLAISPFEDIETEYRAIVLRGKVELLYAKRSENWIFNLGQGARAEIMPANLEVESLVLQAAEVLGINFASVDIVKTPEGLKILEVNSGVMMEYFSQMSAENYEIAKSIYKKALAL